MSSQAYAIPLRDLDEGPKIIDQALPDPWLTQALADTDVTPAGTADGRIKVMLTKTGRDVLVQGKVRATIDVPCSRTLDPARYAVEADIFLMLSPRGSRWGDPGADARKGRTSRSRTRRSTSEEADATLSQEDAATDHYDGEEIVLDDFLREFLLLEIPMVPLREDLRGVTFEGNPSPPGERPLDPRLSPLAELKARLEKKE